ncbi:HAD domain-containing protein [Kribbella sp. NPDC056345]|uniref:HAD domain-containing protein n=1 Tax=Kribbella sp. NPDC056345 TaxID=3345789 RepID=UPI0035D6460B
MPAPLLFLDVDGPLIPFGAAQPYPAYPPYDDMNPLLDRVNPAHGPRLAGLGCELVWATTWMDDANDCVSPRLGFADLPVVTWPDSTGDEPLDLHWKTPTIVHQAAARPFIWLDDEITNTDRDWVQAHHPAPVLLHKVDPTRGLTDADFATLHQWLISEAVVCLVSKEVSSR